MKTIVILGASNTGKDTAINYISEKYNITVSLSKTTRPMRGGEKQMKEYHFVSEDEFFKYEYPIEPRVYETEFGKWYYGTDPDVSGKIVILDFKGTKSLCDFLGRENVCVIKINTDVENLKARGIKRGDDINELNRRLLDDEKVFKGSDKFSDFIVNNNYGVDELYKQIDEVFKEIV